MAKAIGPSFASELKAAGLCGKSFSWGSDGAIQFHPAVSQVDKNAVLEVYAAHDPSAPEPPSQAVLDKAAAKAAIDAAIVSPTSANLKDALAAIKKFL